jgi:hypothetical protein
LATLVSDFDVEIILVFRRADEYAQSLYQWLISSNNYDDEFEKYLDYCAPLFDYAAQREAFRAVFSNVRCVSYHTLGTNTVDRFFRMLDFPVPGEPGPPKHVSTDARLTYWLATRNANRQLTGETFALEKKFTKSEAARELFPDFRSASFWRSADARRHFHDKAAEGFESDFFPNLLPRSERDARLGDSEFDLVTQQFERWKAARAVRRPAPLFGIPRWLGICSRS